MLKFLELSRDQFDYLAKFQYPDGRVVRIRIPLDSDPESWEYLPDGIEVGLNMVTSGHYS